MSHQSLAKAIITRGQNTKIKQVTESLHQQVVRGKCVPGQITLETHWKYHNTFGFAPIFYFFFSQKLFPNLPKSGLVSTSPDSPSTSQVWPITLLIPQHDCCTGEPQALRSAVLSHSAIPLMSQVLKEHAVDCRHVLQSCCSWSECSFFYHNLSFQRIWTPTSRILINNLINSVPGLPTPQYSDTCEVHGSSQHRNAH